MCFTTATRDCWTNPQPMPIQRPFQVNHMEEEGDQAIATVGFLPMNDPTNKSGWIYFDPLSDEFDGTKLDTSKWSTYPKVIGWLGRQPGLFDAANVEVVSYMRCQ